MKKLMVFLLCGAMIFGTVGCQNQESQTTAGQQLGSKSSSGTESLAGKDSKTDTDSESWAESDTGTASESNAGTEKKSGETSAGSEKEESSSSDSPDENTKTDSSDSSRESDESEPPQADIDYSAATKADAASVESFLSELTSIIRSRDWEAFADLIDYPVLINGKTGPSDSDSFLAYVEENGIPDSFIQETTNGGVIANGQGIGIGNGNIWLTDKNFDGIEQKGDPDFRIFSINGI